MPRWLKLLLWLTGLPLLCVGVYVALLLRIGEVSGQFAPAYLKRGGASGAAAYELMLLTHEKIERGWGPSVSLQYLIGRPGLSLAVPESVANDKAKMAVILSPCEHLKSGIPEYLGCHSGSTYFVAITQAPAVPSSTRPATKIHVMNGR